MMTMVRREGEGWVIPLDAELVRQLGLSEHSQVEVLAVGDGLLLTVHPVANPLPGLKELVAEGIAAADRGEVLDHEEVFAEVRRRIAAASQP